MFDSLNFVLKYVGVLYCIVNVDFGKITVMEYKPSLADSTICKFSYNWSNKES